MFDSRNQSRRAAAFKALVALIGATGSLAAVAYATSTPNFGADRERADAARFVLAQRPASPQGKSQLPRPRITKHPKTGTLSSKVSFRYASRLPDPSFQCKLDGAAWKRCAGRISYRGLEPGPHVFLVRVESPGGRSPSARFGWVRTQPKRFVIEPELSALGRLYPGAPPVVVPVVVRNPNPAPIMVTSLGVSVSTDPSGCASGSNLDLIPSNASPKAPLKVPAGGTVRLPAAGISPPALALRNLPVNQDACQGAQFPLAFSGEAHG
jgi:hypothetical protein